jgi:hypothetical protein
MAVLTGAKNILCRTDTDGARNIRSATAIVPLRKPSAAGQGFLFGGHQDWFKSNPKRLFMAYCLNCASADGSLSTRQSARLT